MSIIVKAMKERMRELEYNPASIQRIALTALHEIHNGEVEVVDSATPFGFLLQATATTTSAAIDEAHSLIRKQYPAEAQTEEDLYLHMSDRDYLNRFAMPSSARFIFAFDKEELLQKMVHDEELDIRKLIIPRNTIVTINNIVFTLQYPIEIRQLQHGGVQIVYNNNIETPTQTLESNIIEYNTFFSDDVEWLLFEINLMQLEIRSIVSTPDLVSNIDEDIILNDNFYYIRAYIKQNDQWVEFRTTHTDQVYDITRLTAVIKVFNDRVNVTIPQIYSTIGLLNGQLRFDVYETKGEINADLSIYPPETFVTTFKPDEFDIPSSVYSAPFRNFKTLSIMSRDITDGGNNPMTFEELREAVINNSVGQQIIPITNNQIETSLVRNGYEIVKNIDNITNRTFLATKPMPAPTNTKLITPASASIETIIVNEEELRRLGSTKTNFRSVTITPNTLFESVNGVMKLVPDAKTKAILALTPELRAKEVSTNNYFYTPFHYVLDFELERFNSRPYFLDKPEIINKSFISDNDRTLMQVSIGGMDIKKVDSGYVLAISLKSSKNWKELNDNECFVQLAFIPTGEKHYAYLNGELQGLNEDDERIYHFDLTTNYYINNRDEIQFTKFKMFTKDERLVASKLLNEFDVLFATTKKMPESWRKDDVDDKLGKYLLPSNIHGISNERVKIQFGHALNNLWARSRSIISAADYSRYTEDVPLVYENDVYEYDEVTGSAVEIVNGTVKYKVKYHKGDPVLDKKGAPMYKHRAGDTILNEAGKPVFSNEYSLVRQLDIMMVEGEYWFANDLSSIEYRESLVRHVVNWIVDGLGQINKHLLEQTSIFFYPKSTVGQIDVMINNSIRTIIESGQGFNVRIYVSRNVLSNHDLRNELKDSTTRIIANELKKDIVNNSNIISALKEAYGTDVVAFDVSGLGGKGNVETITVLNDAKRLSLRKRLVAQGDGSLIVEEDITCDFISHDIKDLD